MAEGAAETKVGAESGEGAGGECKTATSPAGEAGEAGTGKSEPGAAKAEAESSESLVTLVEVAAAEKEARETTAAVLGASDSEHCSYDRGHVPRQALYACLSCAKEDSPSGVCLACSLACHSGHDLVELYTKRLFRCDCGNDRQTAVCSLRPDKAADNPANRYNHNFRGRYCVCDRPYPDPDDVVPDSQVQCVVCEDWLHSRHLRDAAAESADAVLKVDWEEMACAACAADRPALRHYAADGLRLLRPQTDAEGRLQCRLPPQADAGPSSAEPPGPLFWQSEEWRRELCSCEACAEDEILGALRTAEDSVAAYERAGQAAGGAEDGLEAALDQAVPDKHQQRELLHGYAAMKDGLMEYLGQLKPQDNVVQPQHINDFFQQLKAKRPKLQ